MDEAMMKFHLELTDTCLDFLARYAFSTCSALPYRYVRVPPANSNRVHR